MVFFGLEMVAIVDDLVIGAVIGSIFSGFFGFSSAQDEADMRRRQEADRKNQIKKRNERNIKNNSSSGAGSVNVKEVDSSYLYSELGDYVQDPNPWAYAVSTITSAISNGMSTKKTANDIWG